MYRRLQRIKVAAAQAESARLRAVVAREAAEKAALEQATDELEAKLRAAMAAEEDFRCVFFAELCTTIVLYSVFPWRQRVEQ